MKIDLCMWTKEGAKTLPQVFQRINQAIPPEAVNQKFIVDDHSKDYTKEIAKLYGWEVRLNKGCGISDGANTTLSYIETPIFASFEQDVLLAQNWWRKIWTLTNKPNFAAASGCRFTSQPRSVNLMEQFSHQHHNQNPLYGRTLDNTLYKTEAIREVGGYPNMKANCGIDIVLSHLLEQKGYKWYVDYSLQSIHIKTSSILSHMKRITWYGTAENEIRNKAGLKPLNLKLTTLKLPRSIPVGLYISAKMKYPQIAALYPIETLSRYQGFIKSRRTTNA